MSLSIKAWQTLLENWGWAKEFHEYILSGKLAKLDFVSAKSN